MTPEMKRNIAMSKDFVSRPGVAIPAAALLHGGLSAYGNALNENQLEKADGRLVLESLLAALGAGAGALGARSITKRAGRYASQLPEQKKEAIKQVLKQNPELEHLRQALPSVTGFLVGGAGAGIAGNAIAPLIAGNLHLVGVPSMSGRQQDYYEEDQPSLSQNELQQIAALLNQS
tara:strand:- start:643 stop:1170 length:528 start_codon:yes stop_codon:yes gene_type:complete